MILALRPQYQAGEGREQGREQPLPWGHLLMAEKSCPERNFFSILPLP